MFPSLEEFDALQSEEHPPLMTRLLKGLANQPAEKVTGLMQTFERLGLQPASGEIPKPYEMAEPTTRGEQFTDIGASLAGDIPFLVAGGAAGRLGETPRLAKMLTQAGAFGAAGLAHSPEEAGTGAATGLGFGAVEGALGWPGKLAAAGALGIGTGAVASAEGASPQQAASQGLINSLLALLLGGRKPKIPLPTTEATVERTGPMGQMELPLSGGRGPRRGGLEPWEISANEARSIAEEKARPTIGEQPDLPFLPPGALTRDVRFTPEAAMEVATAQSRIPFEQSELDLGRIRRRKARSALLPEGMNGEPALTGAEQFERARGQGQMTFAEAPRPVSSANALRDKANELGIKFDGIYGADTGTPKLQFTLKEGPTIALPPNASPAELEASVRKALAERTQGRMSPEEARAKLAELRGEKKNLTESEVATSQLPSEGDVAQLTESNAQRLIKLGATEEELASLEVAPASSGTTSGYTPAVRFRGETFTGATHGDAIDKLAAKFPGYRAEGKPETGYLSSAGFKNLLEVVREKLSASGSTTKTAGAIEGLGTDVKKLKLGSNLGEAGSISPETLTALTRYTAIPALGAVAGYAWDDQHRWGSAVEGAVIAGALGVLGKRGIKLLTKGHPEIKAAKTGVERLSKIKTAMGEDTRDFAKGLFADETMARRAASRWGWSTEYDRLARWVQKNATVDLDATRLREKAWGMAEDLSEMMRKSVMDLSRMKGIEAHFDDINKYFEGDLSYTAFAARVPKEVSSLAGLAAQSRTQLQEIVIAGLGGGALSKKIQQSIGKYLTTTYKVFHDSKYFPTDASIEAAAKSMQKIYGGTIETRLKDIHDYLHEIKASRGMFAGKSGGESLSNIMQRSQDISPEFKEMLGIYDNPLERMGFTGIKLVQAARSAEYFNEVARGIKPNGLKYAYTEAELEAKIATLQNKIKYGTPEEQTASAETLKDIDSYVRNTTGKSQGRLENMFMDVRMRDQLANYDAAMRMFTNPLVRGLVNTTNLIKYGQVILSPLQFVRQVYQMPVLGLMAHTFPTDWAKAFKTLVTDTSEAGIAERQRLKRLGVFAGDPVGGMFRRDMRAMIDGSIDALLNDKLKRGLHKWEEIWRTPDLIIRTSAFQRKEAELLSKGLSAVEAENQAINHMNRYTMNYGAVPPLVVKGRQLPFINQYLSFSYEMMRITKNLTQDALKGDTYAMGVLSGLATLPLIIQNMAEQALSKEDKEEWDKIKNLGPAYSRHDFRFVHGRLPNGDFRYTNFTPLVLHAPWLTTVRAVMAGDKGAAFASNPVLGWENTPLLNVATTFVTGRNRHSGDQLHSTADYLNSIRRDVAPLLLGTELDRIKDSLTRNAEGGIGVINQRTGQTNTVNDLLQTYLTSMRPYTVKPAYIKMQATNEARDRIRSQQITVRRVLNSNAAEDIKERARTQYETAVNQILLDYQEKLGIQEIVPESVSP